jgi:vitamin B12 transporter
VPRAFAALRRSIRFAPPALTSLALAALPARGEETRREAAPIDVVVQAPPGSVRAPAAESTVVETSAFAGEVRSVAELLGSSPGVSLHALGGPGQTATVSLRGATADQSLVLLDGIPLHGPGGGAVDLSTLPATLLDRVVVSRGVLGAQFGAGALGGVVELVPRKAKARGAGAQLSVGSHGTAQLSGDIELAEGGASALAAAELDTTQGDFPYSRQLTPEVSPDYSDFTRENADARRGSALVRWAQQLGADTELAVLLQAGAGVHGLPGPYTTPTQRSRALDQGGLLGARLRGEAGSAAWTVRAWGRIDRLELRGVQVVEDCADGEPSCPRLSQRSMAAHGEAELGFPFGDAHWLRVTAAGGEEWIAGTSTGPHRRGVASLALMDDVRLPGRVSVHPALRAELVGAQAAVSPGIAAAWRPFSGGPLVPVELRAGAGLSFRPPTLTELYLDQGVVLPNPDLEPEHAWSADAGVRWHGQVLTISAAAFYSRYRELISYELSPPIRVKPLNVARARIAGLELQAAVALPQAFVAEASYTYLDAVSLRDGNQDGHHLSYRPPHRLFARLARRGDRIEGYGEAIFVSSMPRDSFDSAKLPAQLTLNAGLGARVVGTLWLDLEAKNLLDDRTHEDLFQYPLPGFTLAALARARF